MASLNHRIRTRKRNKCPKSTTPRTVKHTPSAMVDLLSTIPPSPPQASAPAASIFPRLQYDATDSIPNSLASLSTPQIFPEIQHNMKRVELGAERHSPLSPQPSKAREKKTQQLFRKKKLLNWDPRRAKMNAAEEEHISNLWRSMTRPSTSTLHPNKSECIPRRVLAHPSSRSSQRLNNRLLDEYNQGPTEKTSISAHQEHHPPFIVQNQVAANEHAETTVPEDTTEEEKSELREHEIGNLNLSVPLNDSDEGVESDSDDEFYDARSVVNDMPLEELKATPQNDKVVLSKEIWALVLEEVNRTISLNDLICYCMRTLANFISA